VQTAVATILSAQCTDERVNQVTQGCLAVFRCSCSGECGFEELKPVRSTGFYRNKAKNIQAACGLIQTEFGGHAATDGTVVAATRSGTQDSQCGSRSCLRIHVGVTVDTHVKRLSYRLGLTAHTDPIRIERDLMRLLPQPEWENWSIRLIYHGRAICKAQNPACHACVIADLCPSATNRPH